jgi:hypothetical protein
MGVSGGDETFSETELRAKGCTSLGKRFEHLGGYTSRALCELEKRKMAVNQDELRL